MPTNQSVYDDTLITLSFCQLVVSFMYNFVTIWWIIPFTCCIFVYSKTPLLLSKLFLRVCSVILCDKMKIVCRMSTLLNKQLCQKHILKIATTNYLSTAFQTSK